MPRKPRIEIPGYYHVVNRGVERRVVFKDVKDYKCFEELIYLCAEIYGITIHNYCLMSNHYHLLIEVQQENLSKFIRQLNSTYAIEFNKRYKRSGHLWQGRFKSWYVANEAYFYTLIRYIEQNPLKARIVKDLKEYPFSSYHYFLDIQNLPIALKDSWLVQSFQTDIDGIKEFVEAPIDMTTLQEIKKASSLIVAPDIDKKPDVEKLKKLLQNIEDKKERNKLITKAYKDGYSQHMIAKVLNLSQPTINQIIKRSYE